MGDSTRYTCGTFSTVLYSIFQTSSHFGMISHHCCSNEVDIYLLTCWSLTILIQDYYVHNIQILQSSSSEVEGKIFLTSAAIMCAAQMRVF